MTSATSTHTAVVTLPSDTEILITREFNAPKHLVYKAYTTPELIKRWWSGGRGEFIVAEVDLRVGGTWRYVFVTDDGFEVGFHGEFQEIVPDERLVNTEVYEGAPDGGGAGHNTVTFTEHDGRTTLTMLCRYDSKAVRDAVIESGMEGGMQDSMDHLEQVAVSLR